jgi:hypothetical protein
MSGKEAALESGDLIGTIAIFVFLGIDLALVIAGLLWLSERRAMADRNDMRYRGRAAYRGGSRKLG